MVEGAVIVIGPPDNVQASVQTMVTAAVTNQRFKNYFEIKGFQQIAGKINTSIFRSRSGRIKLVAKNVKKI